MSSARKLLDELGNSMTQEAVELRNYLIANDVKLESLTLSDLLPYLPKAAKSGYAFAFYLLYKIREEGIILQHDLAKARSQCESAANLGFSKAQFDLGIMYAHGLGGEVEFNKAIDCFEKSANSNNPNALCYLGMLYETGQYGLDINYKAALYYYEKSAGFDNVDAIVSLANLCAKGIGVEKDTLKATKLYEKAAGYGSIHAHLQLGIIYNIGSTDIKKDLQKANYHFSCAEKLQSEVDKSTD